MTCFTVVKYFSFTWHVKLKNNKYMLKIIFYFNSVIKNKMQNFIFKGGHCWYLVIMFRFYFIYFSFNLDCAWVYLQYLNLSYVGWIIPDTIMKFSFYAKPHLS